MRMDNALVSVIVATYRREKTLESALRSLIEQNYRPLEIVVIDDNGQDEWNYTVKKVVDSVREMTEDVRIRLIANSENGGSSRARNMGIEAAMGEYITFLDDDDVYLPGKIEKQLAAMRAMDADYSLTDLLLCDKNDRLVEKKTHGYIKSHQKEELIRYHLLYHMTGTDTLMFKKEYLRKIGFFGPHDVGDEYYLMMKAIQGEGRFCYLPEITVKACVHYDQEGVSSGAGKIEGEKTLYRYKQEFFDGLQQKDKRYIRMRHHAVLAFAYFRKKNPVMFVCEALLGILIAPVACISMLRKRRRGVC